jgi:hypothetical protein
MEQSLSSAANSYLADDKISVFIEPNIQLYSLKHAMDPIRSSSTPVYSL